MPGDLFRNNLIHDIYGESVIPSDILKTIAGTRVIISTTNADSLEINETILMSSMSGNIRFYFSATKCRIILKNSFIQ